jgi:hypothetical protein
MTDLRFGTDTDRVARYEEVGSASADTATSQRVTSDHLLKLSTLACRF